jgi:hypothetical protein
MLTEDAALEPAKKVKGRGRISAGAPSIILSTGKQDAHRCTVDKPAPWGTRPLENLHISNSATGSRH